METIIKMNVKINCVHLIEACVVELVGKQSLMGTSKCKDSNKLLKDMSTEDLQRYLQNSNADTLNKLSSIVSSEVHIHCQECITMFYEIYSQTSSSDESL